MQSLLSDRRLTILFLCQAFYWATLIMGVAFSGLIGLQLASHQALATVPMAIMGVGNIMATLPLSIFMQRYGRRAGFMLGAAAIIIGGAVSVYAIIFAQFWWFCVGSVFLGFAQASAFYYRLAATDNVPLERRGSAVAWVLSGGVVAALFAPSLGISLKDILLPYEYLGDFIMVIVFGVLTAIAFCFFPDDEQPAPEVVKESISNDVRQLKEIIVQPTFLVAILNTAVGNSAMILIMVATPLAILACGFDVSDSTSVIQWHVLGMFLPAFFSGKLIDRFGIRAIAIAGCALLSLSAIISITDKALINFYSALFLLGVGWNFLFVAGTTLMTASHRPEERGKVQGFAEFAVATAGTASAFCSGVLLNAWGWETINAVVLGVLIFTLLVNVVMKKKVFSPQ